MNTNNILYNLAIRGDIATDRSHMDIIISLIGEVVSESIWHDDDTDWLQAMAEAEGERIHDQRAFQAEMEYYEREY